VYGESYIVTNAHCLMNEDFTAPVASQDVTITYGRGVKQRDAVVRHATALTIHESFLKLLADADADIIDSEDIALIRIEGKHPAGALAAELPAVTNDYVVCCVPRPRSWPLVWMDVYGFAAQAARERGRAQCRVEGRSAEGALLPPAAARHPAERMGRRPARSLPRRLGRPCLSGRANMDA
jgi:hypothetical protein